MILRLLDNYGHDQIVGLTEIQVFDQMGKFITFYGSQILVRYSNSFFNIRNAISANKAQLVTLLSGRFETTDPSDMWLCKFKPNAPVELVITFKSVNGVGGLSVWNYNKSLVESNKGAKNIEVLSIFLRLGGCQRQNSV